MCAAVARGALYIGTCVTQVPFVQVAPPVDPLPTARPPNTCSQRKPATTHVPNSPTCGPVAHRHSLTVICTQN